MSDAANSTLKELAQLGSATVYEAAGRCAYVDADLFQVVPQSAVAGPARIALCGQDDNLMVHAVMADIAPGDVVVVAMPEPRPVALVGELLAIQAKARGAAAILVDGSVRDVEELRAIGLPIWARWVRIRGATKTAVGKLNTTITVGGATIAPGDVLVLDADGVAVIDQRRVDDVLRAARGREGREATKRERLRTGELSWDIDGLRESVEPRA